MMAVVVSEEDVPTVQAWCLLVGKSRSSVYALCEMVGVLAKAALDLARLLRAARSPDASDLRAAFLAADHRTVDRLLHRAGHVIGSVQFRDNLLTHQRLITDQRVIDRLTHHLRSSSQ
jgi:hypothetical protein